ncbi:MAG TPA: glucose 1-dehydrogenase [Candidatus Atribacteria bacterium]|nr:glucose 1-dehydrogenase [Candidatus Atribacteria bacterium]
MDIELSDKLFDLNGKIAIVTGGASGIGRGMALGLAKYGADVAIADMNLPKALEVKEEIEKLGRQSLALKVDVTNLDSVKKMAEDTLKKFNKINILVCSAGVSINIPALETTEEDWDRVVDVNLKGTFLCNQAVGRIMIEQGGGKIINISSVSGQLGHPNHSPYAASKGGVVLLTKALAVEWAKYNINVNSIGPGYIRTPLTEKRLANKEFYNSVVSKIPMGRLGRIEDMIGPVVFLASDASNYVTGHTLFVEGGRIAD